jgi:hypothetical protein
LTAWRIAFILRLVDEYNQLVESIGCWFHDIAPKIVLLMRKRTQENGSMKNGDLK